MIADLVSHGRMAVRGNSKAPIRTLRGAAGIGLQTTKPDESTTCPNAMQSPRPIRLNPIITALARLFGERL